MTTTLLQAEAIPRLQEVAGHVLTDLMQALVRAREYGTLDVLLVHGCLKLEVRDRDRRLHHVLGLAADADPRAQATVQAYVAAAKQQEPVLLQRALEIAVDGAMQPAALRMLVAAGADPTLYASRAYDLGAVTQLVHGTLLAAALRQYERKADPEGEVLAGIVGAMRPKPLDIVPTAGTLVTRGPNGKEGRPIHLLEYAFLAARHTSDPLSPLTFARACLDLESMDVRLEYGQELGRQLEAQVFDTDDSDGGVPRLIFTRPGELVGAEASTLLRLAVAARDAELFAVDRDLSSSCPFLGRVGLGPAIGMLGNVLHIFANSPHAEASALAVANLARQRPEWLEAAVTLRKVPGRGSALAKPLRTMVEAGVVTPLVMAAANGNLPMVRALLAAGADPRAHDRMAIRRCADDKEIRATLRAASARRAASDALKTAEAAAP